MNVNIEKTKEYYKSDLEVCNCHNCQLYIENIAEIYPKLVEYLLSLGIDYKKTI